MHNRIIFIGGGNIAEAIFAKLLDRQLEILVIQRNEAKRERLSQQYPQIKLLAQLDFVTTANDIIILAIKPQDAKLACIKLRQNTTLSTIVSVMAGVSVATLHRWLHTDKLVRIMPNTPSAIGLGVSGIYFTPHISLEHQQLIKLIFNAIGKSYIFTQESFIDKITPVSGSSPAYIFYLLESLIETAVDQFGFTEAEAKDITLQVMKGSLAMVEANPDQSLTQLRTNVTSKKGATEQAIKVFEEQNLKQIIKAAEIACYKRACELGELFK
jgi:pyrroline-5-carboxylate reductase